MKEIYSEIEIAAPPAVVWQVVVDIGEWQKWCPVINRSEGNPSVGGSVDITMCSKTPGVDGPKYSPTILKLKKERYFEWNAKMFASFLFSNGKIFELHPTATGTRLIHKETFNGLMVAMMERHLEQGVPTILKAMNQALREQAEKLASGSAKQAV